MKKTFLNITLLFVATMLISCDDKAGYDFSKAKSIAPTFSLKNTPYTPPTPEELSLIDSAGTNNIRRVKALLADKKAVITAINQDGVTAFMVAAKANNTEVIEELADYITPQNRAILDSGDKNGYTALHYATEAGAIEAIKTLREAGASTNIYDSRQEFPLNIAVTRNNLEALNALLKIDSDYIPTNVDIQNASGSSAILTATANRNLGMITALTDMQANLNISDVNGITPLILAVKNGDKELFSFLLQSGADINYLSSNEQTALIYAIQNKRYDFAKFIIGKGADPNLFSKGLYSPLQILVSQEGADAKLAELMISKGALLKDPNTPQGNVISRSIKKGNAKIIETLIKNGASVQDIESPYSNGIFEGFKVEDYDIVKLMIENGADIKKLDESGFSALAIASKLEAEDVFELLIKNGADVNQSSKNAAAIPLDIVIEKENPKLLEMMFDNGLQINVNSLLVRIVDEGKFKLMPLLLTREVKTDLVNTVGQPMLWLVVSKENIEAVKLMTEAGANLEVKDKERHLTPLSIAIIKKNQEITTYLLNKGANPNNGDINGITPLAYAALTAQEELIKLIIEKGGDINAKDNSGRSILTLMDSARLDKKTKDRIKKTLIKLGAK